MISTDFNLKSKFMSYEDLVLFNYMPFRVACQAPTSLVLQIETSWKRWTQAISHNSDSAWFDGPFHPLNGWSHAENLSLKNVDLGHAKYGAKKKHDCLRWCFQLVF